MITKNCKQCGIEFRAREWKNKPGIFCSRICSAKGRQMRPLKTITFECEYCKKECTQPLHWKSPHKFCSIQCMAQVRGKNMARELHPNWKGGDNRTGSHTLGKRVKKEIGECQKCSAKENLHIHHKIPVNERPDLSNDKDNIEILCKECHSKEHPRFKGMILKEKSGVYKNCLNCTKEFYKPDYLKDSIFCSKECVLKVQKTGIYRNCNTCNLEYYVVNKNINKSKYCCNKCRYIGTWKIRKEKNQIGN